MILITGGTGYIGKNIALHLLLRGEKVFLLDNFNNSSPDAYHNLKELMKETNIPENNLHVFILDISCSKDMNLWLNNNYPFVRKFPFTLFYENNLFASYFSRFMGVQVRGA